MAELQADCIHHWLIQAPHGEMSLGTCKLCGATREFGVAPDARFLRSRKTTPSVK